MQGTFFTLSLNLGLVLICSLPCKGTETIRMVTDPSLSPDGSQIAFAWRDDIWIASIEGGTATRITTDPHRDSQPHFSADGKRIAFVSDRTGSAQIYVVDALGGVPKQVTFHSEGYSIHDWFPDGKYLLASGSRDQHWRSAERLLKVSVDEPKADVVLFDGTAADASLYRDGKRVLFVREGERWWRKGYEGERAAQVWMLDLVGGELTELLHEGVDCRWPIWQRGGKSFFFTKGDHQGFGLWRYDFGDAEGGIAATQTLLSKFDDDSIVFPSISRNKNRIVFRHLFDLYHFDPRKDDLPVKIELTYAGDPMLDPDELRRELDRATEVTFSDDGLEMIFVAGGDIWAMDTELREPIQLTKTGSHESSLVFAEKGKSIYAIAKRNDQVDIYRVERKEPSAYWWQAAETVWTQITNDPAVESDLRISPDGRHLYFVRGLGELTRRSLVKDEDETIRLAKSFSPPEYDVSPCGHWVAYAESDENFNSEIWITPSDGSRPPINVSQHPSDDNSPKFSPDGKLLAFTGTREDRAIDIHYVWLQAEESQRTIRDRKLAEALAKMTKKRKEAIDSKKTDGQSESASKDESGSDEAKSDTIAPKPDLIAEGKATVIDFERIEDRVKRITIEDSNESNLFWSPEGDKLGFTATVNGQRGVYTIKFPDSLKPEKLSTDIIDQARWSKTANGILGHLSGVPAHVDPSGKVTKYSFTVRQMLSRSDRFRDGFDEAWAVMRDRWYDPRHGTRNWAEVRRKFVDMAANAGDESTFGEIVHLMLGELNGSHNGFSPSIRERLDREGWTDTTAHLGVRFVVNHPGPGLLIRDVLPNGPADRVESRLKPGDVILAIDGVSVDPAMSLTPVLNGRLDRNISLLVKREAGDARTESTFFLRPISYDDARKLLYDHWLDRNRRKVETLSDGRMGYLHIRAMSMESFYDFQRELYRVGYGRDGLVIDVRDNGGGSTTDYLLTALTQPHHAITVPRDGQPGYPQSRMVYAVWQKPIVVLCNQNSYSNAEIFSHAIKTLGRGPLVGVRTAGGVISTGSVRITDVGTMRMPFRGWFLPSTGMDMELNGAEPNHVLWPLPGEIPAGIDRQLDKAIEVLKEELKANPPKKPRLVYASE
jgi:tricorn protease